MKQVIVSKLFFAIIIPDIYTENYRVPVSLIEKQRHYLANKGPFSQGYGFSSGHVWM